MTLAFFPDNVENPKNLARIRDAARLLGGSYSTSITGPLIAVENAPGATQIYGRRPLPGDATVAIGNERRGLSHKTLVTADETVVIPTASRTVNTLNVAAAAAVAGWYLLRGSGAQVLTTRPESRRPTVLIVGHDHVEVGSSLRSAAAFGFREVLLEDRGAGWFTGPGSLRREARAAARRHKNPILVRPSTIDSAIRYEEIVLVMPTGNAGFPIQRTSLTHGYRQLVIIGARPEDVPPKAMDRLRMTSLGLEPSDTAPLRLTASILLAEIARQVGRGHRLPGAWRGPRYQKALQLVAAGEALLIDPADLLDF